jgi:hypothetical protein
MSAPDVVIPRARFEAMARQTLALREQIDALSLLIQSEIAAPATDPRQDTTKRPSTFRTA